MSRICNEWVGVEIRNISQRLSTPGRHIDTKWILWKDMKVTGTQHDECVNIAQVESTEAATGVAAICYSRKVEELFVGRTVCWKNCSVEELLGGRTARWKNCSVEELFGGRTVRWKNCSVEELFGGRTVRWKNCSVEELFGGRTVRWKNCSMEELFDGRTVRWKNGSMEERFGGRTVCGRTVRWKNCSVEELFGGRTVWWKNCLVEVSMMDMNLKMLKKCTRTMDKTEFSWKLHVPNIKNVEWKKEKDRD